MPVVEEYGGPSAEPTYGLAACFVLLALLLVGEDPVPPSSAGIGWCVLLAVLPQLIGHTTLNWALRSMQAATVSIIALGEPVGAIILAAPLLGIVPGPTELVASLVVLAGIWWAGRDAMLSSPEASSREPR